MFLDHGDATMVPNADFSYGKMQFKLQNRTGWHIAACRVRVAFDAGGGMDLVFTDIPPGESRPSSNHFWSLGSSAGENLRKEPFLFPSFVLAARVEGGRVVETADLYERGVSIGFQP